MRFLFILFSLTASFVSADVSTTVQALNIEGAYVRALIPGQSRSAAFMQLSNTTDEKRILVGATSSVADSVELHSHRHENGVMSMQRECEVVIPAQQSIAFKPGGYHFMLLGVNKPLREGESIDFQLEFKTAPSISLELPVKSVLNETH